MSEAVPGYRSLKKGLADERFEGGVSILGPIKHWKRNL